jgi:hypothetical protein
VNESHTDPTPSTLHLKIEDRGAVTELTRGSAYPLPFYENGVPPYDYFWPYI